MRSLCLLILVALVAASGCGRSSPGPPGTASPAESETPRTASYRYEVRGAGGASTYGQAENFSLTAGSNSVAVQGGRLTVNGTGYGLLQDGDSICVDENGRVTVNGTARSPE